MKRILFLTLFFLPFIVVGQVVRNKPVNATTVNQVSDIISDSLATLSLVPPIPSNHVVYGNGTGISSSQNFLYSESPRKFRLRFPSAMGDNEFIVGNYDTSAVFNTRFSFVNDGPVSLGVYRFTNNATASSLSAWKSRGTSSAPLPTVAGDNLGSFYTYARRADGWREAAHFRTYLQSEIDTALFYPSIGLELKGPFNGNNVVALFDHFGTTFGKELNILNRNLYALRLNSIYGDTTAILALQNTQRSLQKHFLVNTTPENYITGSVGDISYSKSGKLFVKKSGEGTNTGWGEVLTNYQTDKVVFGSDSSFVHDPGADSTYMQGQFRHTNAGEANPDSVRVISTAGVVSNASWSQARDSILQVPLTLDGPTQDVLVDAAGYVGINTAPNFPLDVNGDAGFGNVSAGNLILVQPNATVSGSKRPIITGRDSSTQVNGASIAFENGGIEFRGNVNYASSANMVVDSNGAVKVRENLSTESTTDSTQAVLFQITLMNTTSGALAVKVPASPVSGDWFAVSDSRGQAGAKNITIAFTIAAQNLHGSSQDHVISTNKGFAKFVYVDPTIGWIVAN